MLLSCCVAVVLRRCRAGLLLCCGAVVLGAMWLCCSVAWLMGCSVASCSVALFLCCTLLLFGAVADVAEVVVLLKTISTSGSSLNADQSPKSLSSCD